MRVALDAMGGDNAPDVTIEGAIETVTDNEDIHVILVGEEDAIRDRLKGKRYPSESISIFHASQTVLMEDSITFAIRRKKDSSIRKGIDLVKSGDADAFVSAGHSGVVMATALLVLGTSEGVDRPAIATTMPTLKNPFVLIDAGANVDSTPENLLQFAYMGSAYSKNVLGVKNPSVGLLSIGEEDIKGNELTKEAFSMIRSTNLNFVGNVEGKDLYQGEVDVVVCDGFTGNIVLKVSEGLAEAIIRMLKMEIASIATGKLAYLFMKPALKNFKRKTDYAEYGGAPLLGIKGTCIISHGRSSAKAIRNAIKTAEISSKMRVDRIISEELSKLRSSTENLEGSLIN